MRIFGNIRRVAAILMVALWGAVGVVAPAHAAEEELHHMMPHDAVEDGVASGIQSDEEGSFHTEHATHGHSGGCHFHVMARDRFVEISVTAQAVSYVLPSDNEAKQADLSALFHPPRV